jgi:hypothetical protein
MAFVKLGTVLNVKDKKTDGYKKTIKLGQEGSNDPKYDYKVEVRITDGSGKVTKLTNPWVIVKSPHEKAPKTILNELSVFVEDN